VRFGDDRPEEILPIFGCSRFDAGGIPVFDDELLALYVHELCHSYSNSVVERFAADFEPAASKLYPHVATTMRKQAYGDWRTMVAESVVRACTVRCRTVTEGETAGRRQSDEEVRRGFSWVPELARALAAYEADRTRWPTFPDYVPEIVKVFEQVAQRHERQAADRPQLVEVVPANGATDVDPALTTLTLRFDRPMQESWSIVGDPKDVPPRGGEPSFDSSHQLLTVSIRLEPERTYRFSLNSTKFHGFVSRQGLALEPIEVTFTTRAKE
jgi:hypothetical protein